MDIDYSAIRDLPQAAQLSDEDWNLFVERTRTKRIPKGVTLIQAGQLVKHAYFCTMGLFRLYYTLQDGREYNVAFTVENDFATSYGAMVMGTPSFFTIEAMEDSAVIEISYDILKELMDKSRAWERFVYKSVERLYIRKEERERELLYLTAKERYDVFLVKYPGLGHRIPQYHIASYLGITPVSLSRILHSEKD
ncbi:Crp/Fnr family transcriptional regulator [Paenibacillus helianthi]|uniref:Crp/Fnr family transcriptional regulator n=1 Tax=Paenibacillus helianthi TaxID=1349432 RepID=A0ABX3EL83_9BACL|nr:Crp/Fnr family transcriptional regulator [Paenibacillus helianthi]OKP84869.1 Crp/Fnr family transcriptional regulator [Paenibacillus helianthi]